MRGDGDLSKQGPRDWLRQTAGVAAPSGGRERHAVRDRGGHIYTRNRLRSANSGLFSSALAGSAW